LGGMGCKIHYADVKTLAADEGAITFEIEGQRVTVRRNKL
jgi:hypothetical protein